MAQARKARCFCETLNTMLFDHALRVDGLPSIETKDSETKSGSRKQNSAIQKVLCSTRIQEPPGTSNFVCSQCRPWKFLCSSLVIKARRSARACTHGKLFPVSTPRCFVWKSIAFQAPPINKIKHGPRDPKYLPLAPKPSQTSNTSSFWQCHTWTTTHFSSWGFHVLVIASTSIPGLLEISGGNLWWKVQVSRCPSYKEELVEY